MEFLRRFWRADTGQDVFEYSILIALVVCLTAAVYLLNSRSVSGIWNGTIGYLESARLTVS